MLCALFSSRLAYLERNNAMRLHDLNHAVTRARKRAALAAIAYAQGETPKAKRRAERRSKAAFRAQREAERAASDWADWAQA